ncbi:MAG: glycosyl transferase [Gammaproteobacteria bacterium]|nr:TIGR04283 family arsenosugar biosynthesis glycosyltransferase [Gammaproteobacteria bacterium]PCH64937.1 MAG: glycosyl transferase [Gammaproteobacteria bacterium]
MISIVIPVLNEQKALPATLSAIHKQTGSLKWLREIIIVDGGSNDATLSVAEEYKKNLPNINVMHAPRGRASQMNAGAQAASGQWLLFLHADTLLPCDAVEKLYQITQKPHTFAACFKHKFSGRHLGLHFISWLHNLRFRITKVMYGDQAIFVSRSIFFNVGGFPEQNAEDILFSRKLISVCKPKLLNATVITDSRKFEQMGVWQALRYVIAIQIQHRRGKPISYYDFFRDYR